MEPRRALGLGREIVAEIREQNITFMAGSIAHSAFLSLLPLLLLLLIIASAIGYELLTERLVALSRDHLSPAGEGMLHEALVGAAERTGNSVIGAVSLVWGMHRIFRALNTAFGELYGAADVGIADQIVDGLVVLASIALATIGTALATATLGLVDHPLIEAITPLVTVLGLAAAFYPMYYVFPAPDVTAREVLPGTVVAALGWAVLEVAFGAYVELVDTVSTYGLMGAVLVLLIWLYAAAFVLLAGATVNVVLAGRHRERGRRSGTSSAPDGRTAP